MCMSEIFTLDETKNLGSEGHGITTGTSIGTKRGMDVNILSGAGPLSGIAWDHLDVTYPSAVIEVYDFYIGGHGGTLLKTVTIEYTDATKANLLEVSVA